jgi:hypothetical protein
VHDIFVMLVITIARRRRGDVRLRLVCVSLSQGEDGFVAPLACIRSRIVAGLENSIGRHYIAGDFHSRDGVGRRSGQRHSTAGYASTRESVIT